MALHYQAEHWGDAAAEALGNVLDATYEIIGGWSPPGSTREQWAAQSYRWVRVGKFPYFVIWAPGTDAADRVIVRILHASRDLRALMDQTEDWS